MRMKILTTKSSFFSFLILAATLLILEPFIVSSETFTEGMRVSPETVTLKPGQYVWEPERAPEGPLLIVASTTEQVAYVYRNGIRIARSSVSTGRPGHPTPTGFSRSWKRRFIIPRVSTKAPRCLTWSA